jgi:hypothetical protein
MRNGMLVWNLGVFGVFGITPLFADLTNDMIVGTLSSACPLCTPSYTPAFGTTSAGGFNLSGGFDLAQTAWFPDHFGLLARGALNSTAQTQSAGGYAYGVTVESILIPPQQGMQQGDTGAFQVHYHLDGTVSIDVGQTFSESGQLASGGITSIWCGIGWSLRICSSIRMFKAAR